MEDIVRPFQAPEKAPGFRAPSTSGNNPDTASAVIGDRQYGQTDTGPFARTDEPEDYGWWPRLKVLIAGGTEIISDWIAVSESVSINPNICSVWRLQCQSESLSISFSSLELPSWISRLIIWAGVKRVATVEIIINWSVSASAERTLSLGGVNFPDGVAPEWSQDAGASDILIVQITSDGEKYGFAAGLNVGIPS